LEPTHQIPTKEIELVELSCDIIVSSSEDVITSRNLEDDMLIALATLPPDQQYILYAREILGKTLQETAEDINSSSSAVARKQAVALRMLKRGPSSGHIKSYRSFNKLPKYPNSNTGTQMIDGFGCDSYEEAKNSGKKIIPERPLDTLDYELP